MIIPNLAPYKEKFNAIKPVLKKCDNIFNVIDSLNFTFKDIVWRLSEVEVQVDSYGYITEILDAGLNPEDLKIHITCGINFYESFYDKEEQDRAIKTSLSMIGHELIHREQTIKRKKNIEIKADGIKEYLSSPHELMAYGYQIAQELRDFGYSKHKALNLMKFNHKAVEDISCILGVYKMTFTKPSQQLKKLLKHANLYLEALDD